MKKIQHANVEIIVICIVSVFSAQSIACSYTPVEGSDVYGPAAAYSIIANRGIFLERAEKEERAGDKESADSTRYTLEWQEKLHNTLLPEEKSALANIWRNAEDYGLRGDLFFNSSTVTGSESRVIIAIAPKVLPGSLEGKHIHYINLIMDDVCKLKHIKYLSLYGSYLDVNSFEKIASLKSLEYLIAPANITDDMLLMLLKKLPSLKYVRLLDCKNITGSFVQDKVAAKNLIEIKLVNTGFDPKYFVDLISLPCMRFIGLDDMNVYISAGSVRDPFGLKRNRGRGQPTGSALHGVLPKSAK